MHPYGKSERFIASLPGRPQRQSIMRLCGIGCKDYTCISSVLPEDAAFVPAARSDCIC